MNKIIQKTVLILLLPFLACCDNSEVLTSSVKTKNDPQGCGAIIQDILDVTLTKPRFNTLGQLIDNKGFNSDLLFKDNFKYRYWHYNTNHPVYCNLLQFDKSESFYFEYDKEFDFYHVLNPNYNEYYFKYDNFYYFISISLYEGISRSKNDEAFYNSTSISNRYLRFRNDINNSSILLKYTEQYTDFSCSYKSANKGNIEMQINFNTSLWKEIYQATYLDYLCTNSKLDYYELYEDEFKKYTTTLSEYKLCETFISNNLLEALINSSDEELQSLIPTEGLLKNTIGWEAE